MEKKTEVKLSLMNYVAIMALGMLSGMPGLSSPGIQTAIQAFPNVATSTIRMMTTLPNLVAMFGGFAMGAVVGKKFKYRTLTIFSCACAVVGGLGPAFFSGSWSVVLLFRFILGIGCSASRYKTGYIMKAVPPAQTAMMIGWSSAAANVMHVILQPVAGSLADRGFNYSFWVYLIAVVMLVVVILFLKEPEQDTAAKEEKSEKADAPKEKKGFNPWLVALMAISFLNIACLYPFNTGVSSYVVEKGVGTAVIAGTALSLYTFAGMAGNFLLKYINKLLGRYSLFVTDLCIAVGLLILVTATGKVGIYASGIICGFGYIVGSSALQIAGARISTAANVAMYTTLIACVSGAGSFLSSYYITLAHMVVGASSEVLSAYIFSIFVFGAIALFGFIFSRQLFGETKKAREEK